MAAVRHAVRCLPHIVPHIMAQPLIDDWTYGGLPDLPDQPRPQPPIADHDARRCDAARRA
jgi:hypothetical protein